MVKLGTLIDGMTVALQVPASRVRTAASQLRKHKLITTGPRGPGAPDMGPQDATNLLLAIMYDGELAVAEQSVMSLRAASLVRCCHRRFGEAEDRFEDLPRNTFLGALEKPPFTLGDVLDNMLDYWVRYGTIEEGEDTDLDLDVVNLHLKVSCPGYSAVIHFNTHEGFWDLTYEWKAPEQLAYEEANKVNRFATRWDALNGAHLWSSRTVQEYSLWRIADCLRGRPWDDANEEITLPYDSTEAAERQVEGTD